MKLKNLKNKKGFTLIELLVSFAIFGVICTAIVGLLTMSSRSYSRTSAQINLQIEYQIVMNMLNEYIMDCDERIIPDDGILTIFTRTNEYIFTLDDERGLLLGNDLISRNVTAFSSEERANNLIAVSMTFETPSRDGRSYSATQLIALRNSPLIGTGSPEGGDDDEDD